MTKNRGGDVTKSNMRWVVVREEDIWGIELNTSAGLKWSSILKKNRKRRRILKLMFIMYLICREMYLLYKIYLMG